MTQNNIIDLFAKGAQQDAELVDQFAERHLKSGGGGGTFDGMETRVKSLEEDMKKLLQDTAEIKGMLRAAPSAIEFGELKGRVNSLPTTSKVAALLAIAVAVITVITRWSDLMAALL